MRNVNLTIDEETWKKARLHAAQHDTSVSALVRESLRRIVRGDSGGDEEKHQRESLVHMLEEAPLDLGYKPCRKKSYDR